MSDESDNIPVIFDRNYFDRLRAELAAERTARETAERERDECAVKLIEHGAAERYITEIQDTRHECDQLRSQLEASRADAERYAGWSRWRDGMWLISHPESGPSAEWIGPAPDASPATEVRG